MQIIPVIDLLNGVVVHAQKGERQHYQPIQSQLTDSSEPLAIVAALLNLYPFTQLYIADLNAIQKTGDTHYKVIETIAERFPNLTLWVDAGINNNTELSIWQQLNIRLVIGSENFANIGNFCALNHQNKNFALSLDFMQSGFQGPAELLSNTEYWPQDVIVMSLANVGAGLGVNAELLSKTMARAAGHHVIAAGGIRGEADLLQLKNLGIHSALMATALHQKQISTNQLESLSQ